MDEAWYVETLESNPDKIKDKPWYYELRGKYGKIYLYGSNKLAVHITSNLISNRVERENQDIFNLYLKTSEGSTFLFKEENLEMAAKLIKAKTRRVLSDAHKAKLIEAGRSFRYSKGVKHIETGQT